VVLRRLLARGRPSLALLLFATITSGCSDAGSHGQTGTGRDSAAAAEGPLSEQQLPPPPQPGANGTTSDAAFPGAWCPDGDGNVVVGFGAALRLASVYWLAQMRDCETAGLTDQMSDRQSSDWLDYLVNYTYLMMGCPVGSNALVDVDQVDGGILAFGPANVAAIGLEQPRLGREDVANLITRYVAAFVAELGLSPADEAQLSAHLWSVADPAIAPGIAAGLSRCELDAGPSSAPDLGVDDAGAR
jgi:hypothetical protein